MEFRKFEIPRLEELFDTCPMSGVLDFVDTALEGMTHCEFKYSLTSNKMSEVCNAIDEVAKYVAMHLVENKAGGGIYGLEREYYFADLKEYGKTLRYQALPFTQLAHKGMLKGRKPQASTLAYNEGVLNLWGDLLDKATEDITDTPLTFPYRILYTIYEAVTLHAIGQDTYNLLPKRSFVPRNRAFLPSNSVKDIIFRHADDKKVKEEMDIIQGVQQKLAGRFSRLCIAKVSNPATVLEKVPVVKQEEGCVEPESVKKAIKKSVAKVAERLTKLANWGKEAGQHVVVGVQEVFSMLTPSQRKLCPI